MARTQTFLNGETGLSIRHKLNSLANWTASYGYNTDDITHYNGSVYASLIDSNSGNPPHITSSQWKNLSLSSSYALQAMSASWAPHQTVTVSSASWASSSLSASYVPNLYPQTYQESASWASSSLSASTSNTASLSNSASYAITASYAMNAGGTGTQDSCSWASSSISASHLMYGDYTVRILNANNVTLWGNNETLDPQLVMVGYDEGGTYYNFDARNNRIEIDSSFSILGRIDHPSLNIVSPGPDNAIQVNTSKFIVTPSGSVTAVSGFTGSLQGTASNATTASYITSSNIVGTVTSASYTSGTASYATTASYITSSNIVGTVPSASYAITASYALNGGGTTTQISCSWASSSLSASYVPNLYPRINVKTFGAYGDGVTRDNIPIQAAIDTAENAGGGVVFFPSGTYIISGEMAYTVHPEFITEGMSSSLTIKKDNITLLGEGKDVSILKHISASSRNFIGVGSKNVLPAPWPTPCIIKNLSVRSLTFNGRNGEADMGACDTIHAYETVNFTVHDCHFISSSGDSIDNHQDVTRDYTNIGFCRFDYGAENVVASHGGGTVLLHDCIITNYDGPFESTSNLIIENCQIIGTTASVILRNTYKTVFNDSQIFYTVNNPLVEYNIENSGTLEMNNCDVTFPGYIYSSSIKTAHTKSLYLRKCDFNGGKGTAMLHNAADVIIDGCSFTSTYAPIVVYGGSRHKFTNNAFSLPSGVAINFLGTTGSSQCIIERNTFNSCNIKLENPSKYCIIKNNTFIFNVSTDAIRIGPPSGTPTSHSIIGNYFAQSASVQCGIYIIYGKDNVIKDNTGPYISWAGAGTSPQLIVNNIISSQTGTGTGITSSNNSVYINNYNYTGGLVAAIPYP